MPSIQWVDGRRGLIWIDGRRGLQWVDGRRGSPMDWWEKGQDKNNGKNKLGSHSWSYNYFWVFFSSFIKTYYFYHFIWPKAMLDVSHSWHSSFTISRHSLFIHIFNLLLQNFSNKMESNLTEMILWKRSFIFV